MSTDTGTARTPAGDDPAADGRARGYRASRTLGVRTELRRQLTRRRTQVSLGFLVLLPFLLAIAFTFGDSSGGGGGGGGRGGSGLVDLATSGGLNFTVFTVFASVGFLLVVVVALFFGDSVASEASWSSLRYLLAVPVPRSRLLQQKAVVAALVALAGLVLLPVVALALGTVVYGTGPLVSPVGDALPFGTGLLRLLVVVGYTAVQLSWVAGLAMLLSVATDAPLGAVGGAVMATILSEILDAIPALSGVAWVLPTHYSFAFTGALTAELDWDQMTRGALSALLYATAFGTAAWLRFRRKDITS
ncbi:ABC transporter permease subunit [Rhodococcus aerolatus]